MATHSSVLAWRIPGTVEPDGLPSTGLHRVGHDWSDLAAAAEELNTYNRVWYDNEMMGPGLNLLDKKKKKSSFKPEFISRMYLDHLKRVSKYLHLLIELVISENGDIPSHLNPPRLWRKQERWRRALRKCSLHGGKKRPCGPPPDSQCAVYTQGRVEKGGCQTPLKSMRMVCVWRGEHPKLEKKINLKIKITLLLT